MFERRKEPYLGEGVVTNQVSVPFVKSPRVDSPPGRARENIFCEFAVTIEAHIVADKYIK